MNVKFGKHYLPERSQFFDELKQIWIENQVTNSGKADINLSNKLEDFLQVKKVHTVANGTLAIAIALISIQQPNSKAKYVITTPFTHISTVWGIRLSGLTEVLCDIEEEFCSLNPSLVAEKIQEIGKEKIAAIVPVHPLISTSDVYEFSAISEKYSIPVIYDASHSIGVTFKNVSILTYGSMSVASSHATKVFSTAEGGIIVVNKDEKEFHINEVKYFGLDLNGRLLSFGLNGKLNELNAAFGLCSLNDFHKNLTVRKRVDSFYRKNIANQYLKFVKPRDDLNSNYAYFPVILESEHILEKVVANFNRKGIGSRRYFYPSLDKMLKVNGNFKIANSIASRILCIPINYDQTDSESEYVVEILNSALKNN